MTQSDKYASILMATWRIFSIAVMMSIVSADVIAEQKPGETVVPPGRRVSDDEARLTLLQCESALGKTDSSRKQCLVLLQSTNLSWKVRLDLADMLLGWGDYSGAEDIYRRYLKGSPDDKEACIRLVKVLIAAQQFEQAEGMCRQLLLKSAENKDVLINLALIKKEERDFKAAIYMVDDVLVKHTGDKSALLLKGEILLYLKKYDDAEASYKMLINSSEGMIAGRIGLGRALAGKGDKESSRRVFDDVLKIEPGNIPALFYKAILKDASFDLSEQLPPNASVKEIEELGTLCFEKGRMQDAVSCFEKAMIIEPARFSVRLKLAQALAVSRQFDRAFAIFEDLNRQYPESSKLRVEWARSLSWCRKYEESITTYERVAEKNLVMTREMARVAVWAKQDERAQEIYSRLLTPAVDEELSRRLMEGSGGAVSDVFSNIVSNVKRSVESGKPYDGYEWLKDTASLSGLNDDEKQRVQWAMAESMPLYRIQKAVYLESREKHLSWNRSFIQAWKACKELVDFSPGNQEAVYDLAQIEFALGLDREAVQTTGRLLELDPSHNLAPGVLEKMDAIDNPCLNGGLSVWDEKGRAEVADIRRYRYGLGAGFPFSGRGYFGVTAHSWKEETGKPRESFDASGVELNGNGIITSWFRTDMGVTFKDYADNDLDSTVTGYAEAGLNLNDYMTLDLSYERTDELYNGYGIKEKIQADTWILTGRSFLTRYLEVTASGSGRNYSDSNSADHGYLDLSYAFTDHPRIFKAAVFGEARQTRKITDYVYDGSTLLDIIHPYWTPKDYQAGGAMIEWYHDVSPVYSRGTDMRYYDVVLTLKNDTDNNMTVGLKGRLHWELRDSWLLGLEGEMIRSDEWDADGLWVTIRRHF